MARPGKRSWSNQPHPFSPESDLDAFEYDRFRETTGEADWTVSFSVGAPWRRRRFHRRGRTQLVERLLRARKRPFITPLRRSEDRPSCFWKHDPGVSLQS